MSLKLFDETDFQGNSVIIKEDTPDLSTLGFSAKARSLIVTGDPWIVYSDINYKGDFECFTAGNYSSLSSWIDKIKSVRVVKGGLDNPNITLYEADNYKGRAVPLTEPVPSLTTHDFERKALSHKVNKGAWILYSADAYGGEKMVTLKGDEVPKYSEIKWEEKLCSLKPITGKK
ncbi:epidermal differentiation-specific protein-like [Aquarana catesbeiana]|uniref:epidermal differentiation-specific protein-like n=1 Tax=Aquarana catesbeiana TaxID=8400 RepID=UPI003CC9999F